MTDLARDSIHFVVDPISADEAVIHVESDDLPVVGYRVSWRGFLFAGDRGRRAALRFLAENAPSRAAAVVQRALEAGWAFYLNRTPLTREDVVESFGAERPMAA